MGTQPVLKATPRRMLSSDGLEDVVLNHQGITDDHRSKGGQAVDWTGRGQRGHHAFLHDPRQRTWGPRGRWLGGADHHLNTEVHRQVHDVMETSASFNILDRFVHVVDEHAARAGKAGVKVAELSVEDVQGHGSRMTQQSNAPFLTAKQGLPDGVKQMAPS